MLQLTTAHHRGGGGKSEKKRVNVRVSQDSLDSSPHTPSWCHPFPRFPTPQCPETGPVTYTFNTAKKIEKGAASVVKPLAAVEFVLLSNTTALPFQSERKNFTITLGLGRY
jgi:hypothetical protein